MLAACIVAFNSYLPFSDYGMKVFGVLGLIQLAYSIYSWKQITGSADNSLCNISNFSIHLYIRTVTIVRIW